MSTDSVFLYHLVTAEEAAGLQQHDEYRAPSLETEGLIHASGSIEQVIRTANRLFSGQGDLVALRVRRDRIRSEVRYEESGDREPFPHIYGPLSTDAIDAVLRMVRDEAGTFVGIEGE